MELSRMSLVRWLSDALFSLSEIIEMFSPLSLSGGDLSASTILRIASCSSTGPSKRSKVTKNRFRPNKPTTHTQVLFLQISPALQTLRRQANKLCKDCKRNAHFYIKATEEDLFLKNYNYPTNSSPQSHTLETLLPVDVFSMCSITEEINNNNLNDLDY